MVGMSCPGKPGHEVQRYLSISEVILASMYPFGYN